MADEPEYADDFEDQGYEDDFETKPTTKPTTTSAASKQTVANQKQQPQKPLPTAAKSTASKSSKASTPAPSKTTPAASTKPSAGATASVPAASAKARPSTAQSRSEPAAAAAAGSTPAGRSPALLRSTDGQSEERRPACKPAHLVRTEELASFLARVGPAVVHAARVQAHAHARSHRAQESAGSFRIPVARPTETEYEQHIRAALAVQMPSTPAPVSLESGSGAGEGSLASSSAGTSSTAVLPLSSAAAALGAERRWGDAPTVVDTLLHLIAHRSPVACTQLNTGAHGQFVAIAYGPQPLPPSTAEQGGLEEQEYVVEARVRTACLIVVLELRPGRADPSDPVLGLGSGLSRCTPIPYRVCLCTEPTITAVEMQAAGGPKSAVQDACPAVLFASGGSGCVYGWVLSEPPHLHVTSVAWGVRQGVLKQKLGQPQITKLQTPEMLDPCTMLSWPSGLRFPSAYTTLTLLGRDGTGAQGDDMIGAGGAVVGAGSGPGRRMSGVGGGGRGAGKVQVEDGPAVRLQVVQQRGPPWLDLLRSASSSLSASGGGGLTLASATADAALSVGQGWKAGQGLSRLITGLSSSDALSAPSAAAGTSAGAGPGSAVGEGGGGNNSGGGATVQLVAVHQSGRVDLWTFMHHAFPVGKGLESLVSSSATTSTGRAPLGMGRFVLTTSTPPPDPRALPASLLLAQPTPVAGADVSVPAGERPGRAGGEDSGSTSAAGGGQGAGAGGLAGMGAGAMVVAGRGVRGIKALEAENINRLLKRLALERLQVVCAAVCPAPDPTGSSGAGTAGGRVGEGVLLGTQNGLVVQVGLTGGEAVGAGGAGKAPAVVYYHPSATTVACGELETAEGVGRHDQNRHGTPSQPMGTGGSSGVPCTALALNPCPVSLRGKGSALTYIFAAGFSDGCLALYTLGRSLPLASWQGPWTQSTPPPSSQKAAAPSPEPALRAITSLAWRIADPCVLTAMDDRGGVCVWDWRRDTLGPVHATPPPALSPTAAAALVASCPEGDPAGLHTPGCVDCMAVAAHGEHVTLTPAPAPVLSPTASTGQGMLRAAQQWQQCVDAHWLPVLSHAQAS